MVVFDLQEYPENVMPLPLAQQVEVGDTVFSAGNALGEGISYRAGQVASFTPERVYGEWQDIRFSSPASPGNSGGPLLNTAGEVAGVIVQRSNLGENYNIAVPISEINNMGDTADFHARNITLGIRGAIDTLSKDWSYTASLPATVSELSHQAQNALSAFYRTLRKELNEQIKEKNFPHGQRFRYYLRNQPVIRGLASLEPDARFRKWTAKQVDLKKEPLAEEQSVYHGPLRYQKGRRSPGFSYDDMLVLAEKPSQVDLKTFLDSPAMLLETALDAVPYFRYVGRERVAVTSLGKPEKTESWRDSLGRRWSSSLWYLPYNNSFLFARCLPSPKGAMCTIMSTGAGLLTRDYFAAFQEICDKLVAGYEGSIEDWQEYLALGEEYLPRVFHEAEVSYKEGKTRIRLKDFQVVLKNVGMTSDSSLRLHLGYANDQLLGEDLVLLSLIPEKGSSTSYSIRPLFEPSPYDSEEYIRTWQESLSGTGDFSGKKIAKGNQVVVRKTALSTKKSIAGPAEEKIQKVFTVGCTYKASTAEEKDVEQDCDQFFQSIIFAEL
jgi:hypothetical protein